MKKILTIILTFTGLIIGKIIASAVVEAIKHDHKTAPAQRPAAILASEANRKQLLQELNAQLPMMIDEVTRLNKTDLTADGFIYYYQFPTLTAADISASAWQEQTQNITKGLCGNAKTRPLLDDNVSYTYHYADKNGQNIFSLTVHKADCP